MTVSLPARRVGRAVAAAAITLLSTPAHGQPLPWEITVAEIESGRLRQLAQRLSKQNVLFQLHLGDTRKSDLVATAAQIDRILEILQQGSPAHGIPAPWTPALREQLRRVDGVWGPLREIALASPYDYFQVTRQFMPREDRGSDPLLLRYFDNLSLDLVEASEKLILAYDEECRKTDFEICATAATSGYSAMLIERATKEAVFVIAGIDTARNRARLKASLEAYEEQSRANDESAFFAAALSEERGESGRRAREMLADLRRDWAALRAEFAMLSAGDEANFDVRRLLRIQNELIKKVERFTAVLVRFANLTYGT